MQSRRGVSLLEILVAVGIIGLLLGLLIPAVQKVREAALRAKSLNNVRQIMLGAHNWAAANDNQMPGRTDWFGTNVNNIRENIPIYIAIASYLEVRVDRDSFDPGKPATMLVPVYMDPGDPSWLANPILTDTSMQGYCSYPVNVWAFGGANRAIPAGYPDGLSNTIGIGGHYMRCGNGPFSQFRWDINSTFGPTIGRRATFGDRYYLDVYPVSDGKGQTSPSRAGATFQSKPRLNECDSTLPQSPYSSGLIVGMMDGSVRTIGPGVEPSVFWAAVTKDGQEVFDLD